MEELDRFICELMRIRRCIQVYVELYTLPKSTDVLNKFAGDVFGVIQRSMHDEIILSISRLYDGKEYKRGGEIYENLSQLNVVSKYENLLTEKLKRLREETSTLLNNIEIKTYRDWKCAHNEKETSLGKRGTISHKITSENIIALIEKSLELIIGIKSEIEKSESVSIPVMLNEKYEGKGKAFVQKLNEI